EIEYGQRGVEVFVKVFRDAVLLYAQPDVSAIDLEVRFDHPVMAVGPAALKQKLMRPETPAALIIEVAFRAGNGLVNQRDSTGKADSPGLGVLLEKLRVRQAGDGDDLVHEKPAFASRMTWDHEPTPNPSKEGSSTGWPVLLLGGV